MLSDLRFTLRSLGRAPSFVVVAVFTLALGLAVNTAMFSIVNTLLFRALPYAEPDRLALLRLRHPERGWDRADFSWLDFNDWRAHQTSFDGVFAMQSGTFNVAGGDVAPERFTGTWMTGRGLEVLGTRLALGRGWTEDEDRAGAPGVVVISQTLWQTRFGARPDVLGQTLRVNGELVTVIGVAPAQFQFPEESQLWMPRRYSRTEEKRDVRYLEVVGRLRPGVTAEAAERELGVIFARLVQEHPATNAGFEPFVAPLRDQMLGPDVRRLLAIMTGAVTLVLLIACANVANLLLVRGGLRWREIAVRSALGAARRRVVRLLLLESLVLAGAGALAGLPIAWGLLRAFDFAMKISEDGPPPWMEWTIDGAVLGYVLGAVLFACVVAGLVPALRLTRPKLTDVLKDGARGSTAAGTGRLTRALVVAEVALSCVLLVLSGLMIRTVIKAGQVELGYEPAGVLTARIGLPEAQYDTREEQIAFFRDLVERLRQRADVAAVGVSSRLPTWDGDGPVLLEDSPAAGRTSQPLAGSGHVSPGWFETLRVRVRQGRDFDARDDAAAPRVAIVNAAFAEAYWPGAEPLGRRFKLGEEQDVRDEPWVTVVGVVPSIYQGDFEAPVGPEVYLPQAQQGGRYYSIFLRTPGADAAAGAAVLREELRRLDPDLPMYWLQPLSAAIDQARFYQKLFAWIFGIFGGVALVLAGVGIYGVMAYGVSQRTQEIGVRMALGAQPGDVVAMILRQGGLQLGVGLAVGLVLAALAARLMEFVLFGVPPGDPVTFVATGAVLIVAGFGACVVPALRAVQVNPIEALRHG